MKITFFSNYMNHHQLPFCLEMVKYLGHNFKFVATQKISEERLKLGYEDMNSKYDFIVKSYENPDLAIKLALESDIIITGSSPELYSDLRIKNNKVLIRYSERVHKKGFSIKSFLSLLLKRTFKDKNNVYLLCSSAYSALDYSLSGLYWNKTYKWGYFPEIKNYKNVDKIINNKEDNTILWVGRFLDWKHPEVPVYIAKMLKECNYKFKVNMIGIGEEFENIQQMIIDNNLEDNVKLLGSMSPDNVRKYMENSKIFLFTSDRGEGWGAVLNEAMNSCCAVIASHEIGSVPFLIDENVNGFIYENGNINDLFDKVCLLLTDNNKFASIGKEAYNSIIDLWNAKIAAARLIELSESLLRGESFNKYLDGPCSKANIIFDNWFNNNKKSK